MLNFRLPIKCAWGLVTFFGLNVLSAATLNINLNQPGASLNPRMWGVFFEDINFGADGGLYAELVKNRSFEFPQPLMGWKTIGPTNNQGNFTVSDQSPLNSNNTHFLSITVDPKSTGWGLANEGFRGIGIRAGEKYDFSVYARLTNGKPAVRVELIGSDGSVIDAARMVRFSKQWEKHHIKLKSSVTDLKAQLKVYFEGSGSLDVDMISLFPEKTWKNRPGGLRADLVQILADMKPGFLRFPGGCIVEGKYLSTRYQWKTTLGSPEERKLIVNRWNDEFKHRPAPDYYQTFGLGFFEYFQLCEDIGADPLPILNCGMACQFNSSELVPMDQLSVYIQDALDLIEFAIGPVSSQWGAKRAAMGHPKPFNLNLLGVGNEQWGPQYIERYARFSEAIRAKYPQVKLVSSAGPGPNDTNFHFAWPKLRELKADIVDEHCYANPAWFLDNSTRYDSYARTGPKVFMGEYAAQSVKTVSPENRNNWECALAEAAYMTGMERNGDVVTMSSYAPLFGHLDAWQWTPNLIWCDNLNVYGTPNYYVQKLFSLNTGNQIVPVKMVEGPVSTNMQPRLFACASRDLKKSEVIVKVVNATGLSQTVDLKFDDSTFLVKGKQAQVIELAGLPSDENSLGNPRKVFPREKKIRVSVPVFQYDFPPYSLTVMRIPTKQ